MEKDKTGPLEDTLVQYIAIRSDLKWPKGALIAQGAHSSVAVIHLTYSDPDTIKYLENLDKMHKIVIGVPTLDALNDLRQRLESNNVKFNLWVEQPENIPTCLSTKPYQKQRVESFFKNFKLFK